MEKANFYYWDDTAEPHSPAWNMAADELLLSSGAPEWEMPLLRIYFWDRRAMSIGLSQLYPEQYSQNYAVVRRPTGGGNVFHDVDLTYTVVIPAGHKYAALNRMDSYRIFHEAMLPVFAGAGVESVLQQSEQKEADRATMQCFVSPSRFDLVDRSGRNKYAGAAQRRTRQGILHQGSVLLSVAGGDREKLIRMIKEAFCTRLGAVFTSWTPAEEFAGEVAALAESKYEKDEWNRAAGA